MTTREQDAAIERLALEHGRVAVRHGYEGGLVYASVPPWGECWKITEGGVPKRTQRDGATDWGEG